MNGPFKQETIDKAIALHTKPDRQKWKYLPLTVKQISFLERCGITPEVINKLDRGAACILINHIIDMNKDAYAWGFPDDEDDFD
jgi:hypothetical protein